VEEIYRKVSSLNRPLTLYAISDELLAECGLVRGAARGTSYRCTDPAALYLPLGNMIVPQGRKLNEAALKKILLGFRDGDDIPPVEAFYEPRTTEFHLLDGAHRWRASLAFGFRQIPCELKSRDFAEVARGYRTPEQP
jgi:hypothetical protein